MRKRSTSPVAALFVTALLFLALTALQHFGLIEPDAAATSRAADPGAPAQAEPAAAERPTRRSPGDARLAAVVSRVIDGDTFVLADGQRVRVADFDTPETRGARCAEERQLGQAATEAARRLLLRRRVDLRVTGRDRYERLVADVRLPGAASRGGPDFRDQMMAAGHGAVWDYGREPKPDWCGDRAKT